MTPGSLVRRLAEHRLADTFNPYADRCPHHDRHDAAAIRRRNLRRALGAALDARVSTIWIGRDLGYRGGRRTGLALTDEAHLAAVGRLLGCAPFERATLGRPLAERTAGVVWDVLARLDEPVFLWNVFPLHPHAPGEPLSNRAHTRAEAAAVRPVLDSLLELLAPTRVLAIGRDAERALDHLGVDVVGVRHPSFGGARAFRDGVLARQAAGARRWRDRCGAGGSDVPPQE